MNPSTHDVVICGAGIAGISAACFLARAGVHDVVIVDERAPLDLTSSRSTECYRNWWPDPAMLALMNRSIDLLEELADSSGNAFSLNRRGYLYATADARSLTSLRERAQRIAGLGAGPLRIHGGDGERDAPAYQPARSDGFHESPDGADLLLGSALIRRYFPALSEAAVAALHVRRAGWLSAQQLGMHMLEEARSSGLRVERTRVTGLKVEDGRLQSISLADGTLLRAGAFVDAAGPFLADVGRMAGLELPVYSELHQKATFRDSLRAIPREAPLMIWNDPQRLPWTGSERAQLEEDPDARWMGDEFPAGVHARPEGDAQSQSVLMLWDYRNRIMQPELPPVLDEGFPELALRGLATMLPDLRGYFNRLPRPQLDGGYYTRTRENRPLIGPTPVSGVFVCGAVSGFGIMSACAVGELLAAHVAGRPLPPYAEAFALSRYDDAKYREQIDSLTEAGQL